MLDEQRAGQPEGRLDSNTKDLSMYSKSVGRTETTRSTEGSEQTSKQIEKNVSEERGQNQSNVEKGTNEGQHIGNAETDVQSKRARVDDLELSTKTHKDLKQKSCCF